MGTAQIVELTRAYGLHPRLWLLVINESSSTALECALRSSKTLFFNTNSSLNFSRLLLLLASGDRRLKALGDNAVR